MTRFNTIIAGLALAMLLGVPAASAAADAELRPVDVAHEACLEAPADAVAFCQEMVAMQFEEDMDMWWPTVVSFLIRNCLEIHHSSDSTGQSTTTYSWDCFGSVAGPVGEPPSVHGEYSLGCLAAEGASSCDLGKYHPAPRGAGVKGCTPGAGARVCIAA